MSHYIGPVLGTLACTTVLVFCIKEARYPIALLMLFFIVILWVQDAILFPRYKKVRS